MKKDEHFNRCVTASIKCSLTYEEWKQQQLAKMPPALLSNISEKMLREMYNKNTWDKFVENYHKKSKEKD
ncbi:MAG: hypothetical protein A2298_05485 [Gammaproteobacteria bacterium RIFOXYB2_FULL_38_6]|nr:MAG: hypothetical protein A2298_05485 [Gammaproteobacteria bacterium RIFOXYB2_FULL_38_6]